MYEMINRGTEMGLGSMLAKSSLMKTVYFRSVFPEKCNWLKEVFHKVFVII